MWRRSGYGSSVDSGAGSAIIYDYRICHYAVAVWWLVFRSSPYGRQDSLLQCSVQFIRMWHRGPGRSLLSMIVMTCYFEVLWWVCLSVCSHISKTTRPNFSKFFVRDVYGCGSVRLWRLCDVMYFRFCGWRRVFTLWALWHVMCISKWRQRNNPTNQILLTNKDWQMHAGVKSAIYNFLVLWRKLLYNTRTWQCDNN